MNPIQIIVASKNPVKIRAVENGFTRLFPSHSYECRGIDGESGVGAQPVTDKETKQGAANRVKNARRTNREAEYIVGLEGGIEDKDGAMGSFAWVCVADKSGKIGFARTSTFFLPHAIRKLVMEGKELGEADDIVFKKENSKQKEGAVGILTGGVIDREMYYTEAVILAFIPFLNPTLFDHEISLRG